MRQVAYVVLLDVTLCRPSKRYHDIKNLYYCFNINYGVHDIAPKHHVSLYLVIEDFFMILRLFKDVVFK